MNNKRIRNCFKKFSLLTQKFFTEYMETIVLEGEVDIDESQIFKRKKSKAAARGYANQRYWLIGFKERRTKRFFLKMVPEKNKAIIISLIIRHIKFGSTIYSDSYSVYVNPYTKQSNLMKYNYIHYFVNHSKSFVHSFSNQIHTNIIEGFWRIAKKQIKSMRRSSTIELALSRFAFHSLLDHQDQLNYMIESITNRS